MSSKQGFTLLELSIVLVIIGLIVGGVLAGQELIRNAEVNSIISDAEKYKASVNAFRFKYDGVPGDLKGADDYWGTVTEGNGNGMIETATSNGEIVQAWEHLEQAGLIKATVTGTAANRSSYVPEVNMVGSRAGGGYMLNWRTDDSANANMIVYGGTSTGADLTQDIISPQDAQSIENKYDDGQPGVGNVLVLEGTGTDGCDNDGVGAAKTLDLSEETKLCIVAFRL